MEEEPPFWNEYPVSVFGLPTSSRGRSADLAQREMKDLREQLERLRADANECDRISKSAPDPAKRKLFRRLAEQLALEALELEQILKEQEH
jgi:hypothetical protein